ncbi:hypothetical protein I302_104818 [Kwoniella bestiolae CBS 10118]|uniref:3'-5' exonuclease domain-containing protein n=1 Tax=Kwoniella bestiolae CBS 10118 TaxID=1296100 RepID=A0A1B9FRN9_9TREE|nr:hypothetical protein I302_09113 [Kwoniella bestiolae CBS 10118]OCF21434.1 hypothetical protein I302_09113 [Kwoniella bestiolae CBS 10118]
MPAIKTSYLPRYSPRPKATARSVSHVLGSGEHPAICPESPMPPVLNTTPSADIPIYHHSRLEPPPILQYTSSPHLAKTLVKTLEGDVVGLDVEYDSHTILSSGSYKPALLQLCDAKTVLLIQLKNGMDTALPKTVIQLLCNPNILKVGVGNHNDCANLIRAYRLQFRRNGSIVKQPKSFLELEDHARHVDPSLWSNHETHGLSGLSQTYLGKRLVKNCHNHKGGWMEELTQDQKDYAANDATSSLQIYLELMSRSNAMGKQLDMKKLCRPVDVAAVLRRAGHNGVKK